MANISRRRTGEFLRCVYEYLWDQPEGLPAKDVLDHIARSMGLTDYESGEYPSSPEIKRFEKIIRFATIDLVKAGWMVKTKGRWIITDLGREAYKKHPDPDAFYKEAVRLYHEWKKKRPKKDPTDLSVPDATTDEQRITSWHMKRPRKKHGVR